MSDNNILSGEGCRVGFVLEDDFLQREIILDVLNDMFLNHINFLAFSRTRDLVVACQEIVPDIIVSDLELPDSDAVATLSSLNSLAQRCIPVFVYSAHECVDKYSSDNNNKKFLFFLSKKKGVEEVALIIKKTVAALWSEP